MRSPGINTEGELRGQPANPGLPRKMAVQTECVCVCLIVCLFALLQPSHSVCVASEHVFIYLVMGCHVKFSSSALNHHMHAVDY